MRTHQHGSLRLRQPLVFRLVYGAALAIFGLLTLVTGALSVLTAAPPHIVATLFFLSLLLLALYLVPLLLSSYIAATSGIERHGLFGARQEIAWADVTRVSVYPSDSSEASSISWAVTANGSPSPESCPDSSI